MWSSKKKGRKHRSSRDGHDSRRRSRHEEIQKESENVEFTEDDEIPRITGPIADPSTTILDQEDSQATSPLYAYWEERSLESERLADSIAQVQIFHNTDQEDCQKNVADEYEEEEKAPEYEFIVDEERAYFKLKDGEQPRKNYSSQYPAREAQTKAGERRFRCERKKCLEKNVMFAKHKELYKHFCENHTKGKNSSPAISSSSKSPQHSQFRKYVHPHATRRPSVTEQDLGNIPFEDSVGQAKRGEPFPNVEDGSSYSKQFQPTVNYQARPAFNREPFPHGRVSYSTPYNGNNSKISFSQQPSYGNWQVTPNNRSNWTSSEPRNFQSASNNFSGGSQDASKSAFGHQQDEYSAQSPTGARTGSDGSIRHITTTDPSTDTDLHKDFKVHPSKRFKFGHVFKILWVEPQGQVGRKGETQRTSDSELPSKFGEKGYFSIRRFLIVREEEGHCLCLPILTYRKQGTAKPGVKPYHHAIIYMDSRGPNGFRPREAKGEPQLPNEPICVKPKEAHYKLDPTSRLNYAKIYTVEHNIKVCFIGMVHEKSTAALVRDYNKIHTLLSPPAGSTEEKDTAYAQGGGEPSGNGWVHPNNRNYRY